MNYDDISGRTDVVTSGKSNGGNRTLYVLRDRFGSITSPRFQKLLHCVRELEEFFQSDRLDIEFVVSRELEVFILQVRPLITAVSATANNESEIYDCIRSASNTFLNHFGERRLLGQMPDWNPAEMIGTVATPLALSMYATLITDSVWAEARLSMGYKSPPNTQLLYDFCGHPYIDVSKSFESFLPQSLDPKISNTLLKYWIRVLESKPELHDKIEFDVAITCFDFSIEERLRCLPIRAVR